MYTSNLRRVGGSIMLAVPPAILDMVQLQSGASVSLMVESGRLIVSPTPKKKYSLQELLTQCDVSAPLPEADDAWTSAAPVGKELI